MATIHLSNISLPERRFVKSSRVIRLKSRFLKTMKPRGQRIHRRKHVGKPPLNTCFWTNQMGRRTLPGAQTSENNQSWDVTLFHVTDELTDVRRGKRHPKLSWYLRLVVRHKPKVFCTLLCMGKGATLSRFLSHARLGVSLQTHVSIYIYTCTCIYIYIYILERNWKRTCTLVSANLARCLFGGFSFHGLKKLKVGDSWIHSTAQRKEHSKTEFEKRQLEEKSKESETFSGRKFSPAAKDG